MRNCKSGAVSHFLKSIRRVPIGVQTRASSRPDPQQAMPPNPSDPNEPTAMPAEDRRAPESARGLGVKLRRFKGLLRQPMGIERRGLQLDLVIVDRRRLPDIHRPPTPAQVREDLRLRLMAIDQNHATHGMRQLIRVHDQLRRKGWAGVQSMSARDLGRALAQSQLLASLEESRPLGLLIEQLRLYQAAAKLREERVAQARSETSVEVDEGDFDDFERTSRAWVDTVSPHSETAGG